MSQNMWNMQNMWNGLHMIAPLVVYSLLPSVRVFVMGLLWIPKWSGPIPLWADWLKRIMIFLLMYRGLVPTTTLLGLGYRMWVDVFLWAWVLQKGSEREMLSMIPYDEIANDVVRKQTWTKSDHLVDKLRTHGIVFRDYCVSIVFFLGITGFRNRFSGWVFLGILNVLYIHGFVPTFLLVQCAAIIVAYIQNLPDEQRIIPPTGPFFANTLHSYYDVLFHRSGTIERTATIPAPPSGNTTETKEAIRRLDDILSQTLLEIFSLPPPKEKSM